MTMEGRDAPPSHYLIKIQSFSLLSKASKDKYDFGEFEAGGYKWKLSIYPNGDKTRNVQDHISMYLELADTSSLPVGWEVNVSFNLFTFNQFQDKYFSLQDGRVRRFHAMKTKWGIPEFMDLRTFCDPSNGYLVDDTCVFGAEVFIVKSTFKGECLKMISEPATYKHTLKVDNFSKLKDDYCQVDSFVVGDYKWTLDLYPKGHSNDRGTYMSLYLYLDYTTPPSDTKLSVKFIVCVKDQINQKHFVFENIELFGRYTTWLSSKLISLAKLKDLKNGFLVGDTCIIEAVVTVLGSIE